MDVIEKNIGREERCAPTIVDLPKRRGYEFVKRLSDLLLSIIALIILSPVMIVIAVVIFFGDFHSPFFVQTRLTKGGKEFKMVKFRSMCVDAEDKLKELQCMNEADGPVFKIEEDPRITRVGRFIRKTSIDELPQLLNIISGSMSIVGPRPPLPLEVLQYDEFAMQRLSVKGGLTCYWQCSGRSELSFDEWMRLDVQYIKDRSIKTDVKIIFRTFKAVFSGKGAM